MKTIRDKMNRVAEMRRFPRIRDRDLFAIIDGATYRTRDWSLGGFMLAEYPRIVNVGDVIIGELRASEGLSETANFRGVIAWIEGVSVGIRFTSVAEIDFILDSSELHLEDKNKLKYLEVIKDADEASNKENES